MGNREQRDALLYRLLVHDHLRFHGNGAGALVQQRVDRPEGIHVTTLYVGK